MPTKDKNELSKSGWLESTLTSSYLNLKIHQNRLSAAAVLFIMVFGCEACGSSFKYNNDRGLRWHQINCEEFLQADDVASTVDNALEKYRRKRKRKKHKAAHSDDNIEGRCSDSESGEESGEEDEENLEEDDLGAEDAEGFLDAEDEEGYAAL